MTISELENRIKELELELSNLKSGIAASKITGNPAQEESYTKFLSLANCISSYIAYINADTLRYEFVNSMYVKSFGLPIEKIIGSHIKDVIGKNSYSFALKHIEEVKSGNLVSYENIFDTNTGKKWINVNYSPVFDDYGKVVGIAVVGYDIAERKQYEKSLLESEERFQLLFNKAPLGYQSLDFDGNFIEVNQTWLDLLGYTIDEVIGKWFGDFLSPAYQDGFRKRFPIFKAQGKIHSEFEMVHKNGNILFIAFEGKIGYDSNGEFKQTHCILADVTERKKAESELKIAKEKGEENEQKLKQSDRVFNLTLDMFCIAGFDGYFKYLNPAWERTLGWSVEELLSKPWLDFVHPDDAEKTENIKSVIVDGKEIYQFENRYISKDGSIKWLSWNSQPFPEDNIMIGAVRDITQQKKIELELIKAKEKAEESENRLIEAQRIAKLGNWFIDFQDGHLKWSKSCYSIIEINENVKKEELRKTLSEKIHPEDLIQLDILNKQSIENIESFKFEYRVLLKNGVKNILLISEPVLNSENKFIGTKGTIQDVTEQKLAEQELIGAKERAEESDRLKSAFLANISHEIRTPMNGILGFTDLLKEPNLTGEKQKEFIEIIQRSGHRMLSTVNSIVEISKIEAGKLEIDIQEIDINAKIHDIYSFFKPEVEKKGLQLFIKNSLTVKEAIIITDPEKLYSILSNLVNNAIKYTNKGSIEIGCEKKDKSLEFYVKDTGIGIPLDRQEAIFERFIHADIGNRRAFQGVGLGLSIAKSYVELLGGRIWVESEVEKGSIFYFTIPCIAKTFSENEIINTDSQSITNLKILIAEDDEISYSYLIEILKDISKECINASTGKETVEICRKHNDIDIVLMDIRMPDMDGYEATRQIRQFNKEIVIIAQTAHGLSGDREKAIQAGCNDYISKPIGIELLKEKVGKHFIK